MTQDRVVKCRYGSIWLWLWIHLSLQCVCMKEEAYVTWAGMCIIWNVSTSCVSSKEEHLFMVYYTPLLLSRDPYCHFTAISVRPWTKCGPIRHISLSLIKRPSLLSCIREHCSYIYSIYWINTPNCFAWLHNIQNHSSFAFWSAIYNIYNILYTIYNWT